MAEFTTDTATPNFTRSDRTDEKQAALKRLQHARALETAFEGNEHDDVARMKNRQSLSHRTRAYKMAVALRDDIIAHNYPKSADRLMNDNAASRRQFRTRLNKELGLRIVDRLTNLGYPGVPSKPARDFAGAVVHPRRIL